MIDQQAPSERMPAEACCAPTTPQHLAMSSVFSSNIPKQTQDNFLLLNRAVLSIPHSIQTPACGSKAAHSNSCASTSPKKPVGLQHNRCADESRVKKGINIHQQKRVFLSQIAPISNSKENNPYSSALKKYTVFQETQCEDFAEFRHSTGLM